MTDHIINVVAVALSRSSVIQDNFILEVVLINHFKKGEMKEVNQMVDGRGKFNMK